MRKPETYALVDLNRYSFPLDANSNWYVVYSASMKTIHFCAEMGDNELQLDRPDNPIYMRSDHRSVSSVSSGYAIEYKHVQYRGGHK